MKKRQFIPLAIILFIFLISFYYYPKLPNIMATHWNSKGQVDGYSNKNTFTLLFLSFLIGLYLLFLVIPKIDPLAKNIKKFINYYYGFIVIFFLFMAYIYIIIILTNLGYTININYLIIPVFSVLFYYIGIMLSKAKRNWFIGIRTPWTLSSDRVWKKIHKLGSKLFKLYALYLLVLLFSQNVLINYFLYVFLVPILTISFGLAIFSYFEYRKEKKKI